MIVRYGIANIEPLEVATAGRVANLSGSVTSGLGFTPEWGIEPTTFVEFAGHNVVATDSFVRGLLLAKGEQCAYKTCDGVASLLWADVRVPATILG